MYAWGSDMTDYVYSKDGKPLGFIDGDYIYALSGKLVGQLRGDSVYTKNGKRGTRAAHSAVSLPCSSA